ncbi:MAG: hypothetical protein AAFO63_00400, partial [Pseudomonadota bacterium]
AADCKSVYTGSIPVLASNFFNRLSAYCATPPDESKHLSKHSVFSVLESRVAPTHGNSIRMRFAEILCAVVTHPDARSFLAECSSMDWVLFFAVALFISPNMRPTSFLQAAAISLVGSVPANAAPVDLTGLSRERQVAFGTMIWE